MSFVIKATVYMTAAEYEAVEVKRGDIEYIVDDGNYLKSYVGDIRVDTIDFSEFTEAQKAEIKSWAQEAAEQSAQAAEASAVAAKASEDAAKESENKAANYAEIASKAEGYDKSARDAALAALKASNASVMAATKALTERILAESFTHGNTGARDNENTDNARYYKDLAKTISGDISDVAEHVEEVSNHVDNVALEIESDRQDVISMKADVTAMKASVEQSEQNASISETNAANSAAAASASETNAANSAADALIYKNAAKASEDAAKASEEAAATSETNAAVSETNAHNSEVAAKASEDAAKNSENAAKASEDAAKDSEYAAKNSEDAAATSKTNAHSSELAAKDSEDAAKASETAAATSETNAANSEFSANASKIAAANSAAAALTSEQHAKTSETNAANSASAAATSELNASISETNAANSAAAALTSEQHASASETNAHNSEVAAALSETNAHNSEVAALGSQTAAANSAAAALNSENAAKTSETNAATSATNAHNSEVAAATSEENAEDSALLSKSWAVGDTGVREGEDTNNAAYWAEEARKLSPDGKADKVLGGDTDGMVAGLDATGNLTNTGVPSNNIALRDGYYGAEGLGAHTAEQLIDPNAPATERKFGFDTACGDISISDNGNAMPEKLMGTTHVANQLVHATNMNTKSSTDGKLSMTDAVGGNLSKLEIHGGCVVHNQLVKESVTKTISGTGRLGCSDGVAGNAESFVMTAPISVVTNQLVQNGDFGDGTTGWNAQVGSATITDGLYKLTASGAGCGVYGSSVKITKGHIYILRVGIRVNAERRISVACINNGSYVTNEQGTILAADTWSNLMFRVSGNSTSATSFIRIKSYDSVSGDVHEIKDIQVVDLTQYFNGNTTLINSITSWDDLVAYDPSFASYVPYNTGTVKGVQPTVKVNHATDVACPVELFGIGNTIVDSFDGASGVVTRKVGVVDMGTLTWGYEPSQPRFTCTIPDIVYSDGWSAKMLCAKYVSMAGNPTDKRISQYHKGILIRDTAYTDATTFKAAMSGVYLCYPLATPTTSQYNGTTIPTADIYNSAVQTSNERLASLSMTYQGREQTITLNPTHVYAFNDNQVEDSVITNESSIDAVGGEDMLVDVTQFYNGDSARISQIQRWASLSTRFHRYRDLLPYNSGTVEPDTPVIRLFNDEYAYGVIYDPSTSSPTLQMVTLNNGVISEVSSFTSMPCHNLYRCVMDDLSTRHINYYLDDTDSTKKYNGTRNGVTSDGSASVLTGADGDVMVEIPISYWYLDEDYNGTGKYLYLISDKPFMGTHGPAEIHDFFYVSDDGGTVNTQYVGAYRASVCDAEGNPLNTTEGALTQTTGTASTNTVRSIAGTLPYVLVSLNDLTVKAARTGATTVNSKFHQWLMLLMVIEYGTLNTQSISLGYSNGKTNALWAWRKSGRTNYGNGTGETFAISGTQDDDNFYSLKVNNVQLYRDVERDANNYFAWSNHAATPTVYWTESALPGNGVTAYSDSEGTASSYTTTNWSTTTDVNKVIQFQYRGIENPFGEVYEFEHGIQVYNSSDVASIKVNNVVYTREPSMDGTSSRAFVNDTTYMWIGLTLPSNAHAFLDKDLIQDSGYVATVNSYTRYNNGYWETLAISDYTTTAQQTVTNSNYTWKAFPWALTNGYIKKFDPITFFAKTVGWSATTYIPDYFYTTTSGSRVVFRGGNAAYGSYDGLAYVHVAPGLTFANVYISGRLSARNVVA